MKKILVVLPLTKEQRERFRETAPEAELIYKNKTEVTDSDLEGVTAVIGNLPPALLQKNQGLQWVQLNSAGTDGYTAPGVLAEQAVLTNATGAYGVAIAVHLVGALLLLLKKFPAYLEHQKAHQWRDEGTVKPIYETTTLIVGMGDIGTEFAVRMRAFGSHIIGVRRTVREKPGCVDEMYTTEHLKELLGRADITAICLPGTRETYHLFSEEMLRAMKPGSVLLNVGRGNVVDTDSLIRVLEDGHLGGAALDVLEEEPLPQDSPLWDCPNVFITPHVSGGFHLPHTLDTIVAISRENLDVYLHGGSYRSLVDRSTGYKKSGT